MNSISMRTESLQPEGSASMDEGEDSEELVLRDGEGDVDELGVDVTEFWRIVSSTSRSS